MKATLHVVAVTALFGCGRHGAAVPPTPLGLDLYVPVPADNPTTVAKVALGQRLFLDPRLSRDRTVSCSSCHRPEHGFSDTTSRSIGAFDRRTRRSAPSLVNVAYARFLFWDGREISLETQVLHPIRDSLEMALPLADLEARLRADAEYRKRFARVFPDGITAANVGRALASYLRTLRFGAAPLDRYRAGDTTALHDQARRGLALFRGKARCSTCHIGPNLTDEGFHNTGVSWGFGDAGRYPFTGREEDQGRFNTPSLRAAACTAPYMHDGSLRTLEDVLAFYVRGGNPNPNLDEDIGPLDLGPEERQSLLTFLRSLVAGECGSRGQ